MTEIVTPQQAMRTFQQMVKALEAERKKHLEMARANLDGDLVYAALGSLKSVEEIDTKLEALVDAEEIFGEMLP